MYIKLKLIWGPIVVGLNEKAQIFGLWFEGQKYFPVIHKDELCITIDDTESSQLIIGEIDDAKMKKVIYNLIKQLREYEEGKRKVFELPLAPKGTDFQKQVWDILKEIPYGKTDSYGKIAGKIALMNNKKSMSAQAVGSAVGRNPISIIVPCHRVVGRNGALTGYAGGIEKKEGLLAHEDLTTI